MGQTEASIQSILKTLPHRYPFLLVDRVWNISEQGCLGSKNVTANEPCFQGHFPENPVFPGVLLVEGMAQCGAVAARTVLDAQEGDQERTQPVELLFIGIDQCRFKRIVVPGDVVTFSIEFTKLTTRLLKFRAIARVGEEVACEADLMALSRQGD